MNASTLCAATDSRPVALHSPDPADCDPSHGNARADGVVGPGMSENQFTMFTTPWCGYCHRLKSQLDREGITFDIVDIEQQPDAAFTVEQANGGNQTVPTLLFSDGSTLTNPSVAAVKDKLAALA
jgi:mycoredoxin